MTAAFYTRVTKSPEELLAHDRVLGDLAEATRELADAQLRTEVELAEAEAVAREIRALTRRLLAAARPGPLGTELGPGPTDVRNHGNAVVGLRNPFACVRKENRRVTADKHVIFEVTLGAAYEGPPGLVHGGVSALLLDQVLGEAAAVAGAPGMTGRLTTHYRRPTPLGPLRLEAWLESSEGRKSVVRGEIRNPDGEVTVEAEGLFILPRWATDHPSWRSHDDRSPFE